MNYSIFVLIQVFNVS